MIKKIALFLFFLIIVYVLFMLGFEELNVKTNKRAVEIQEYINKYYLSNDRFPDISSIDKNVNYLFFYKNEIEIIYNNHGPNTYIISYPELPLGPSNNYFSEKKAWEYLE